MSAIPKLVIRSGQGLGHRGFPRLKPRLLAPVGGRALLLRRPASMNSVRGLPPLHRAMASLCLQFPVDCYKPGPTRPDHNGHPIASRLGVDPQLGKLSAPPGSRLPHLAAWTEDFLASGKGMPDDEFLQIYKVYAELNPKRAQVPPECMEEFMATMATMATPLS